MTPLGAAFAAVFLPGRSGEESVTGANARGALSRRVPAPFTCPQVSMAGSCGLAAPPGGTPSPGPRRGLLDLGHGFPGGGSVGQRGQEEVAVEMQIRARGARGLGGQGSGAAGQALRVPPTPARLSLVGRGGPRLLQEQGPPSEPRQAAVWPDWRQGGVALGQRAGAQPGGDGKQRRVGARSAAPSGEAAAGTGCGYAACAASPHTSGFPWPTAPPPAGVHLCDGLGGREPRPMCWHPRASPPADGVSASRSHTAGSSPTLAGQTHRVGAWIRGPGAVGSHPQ